MDSITDAITLSVHSNDHDYWIIVHGWNSDKFFSIPVANDGIGEPVVNEIGSFIGYNSFSSMGQIKISPNDKKLAISVFTGFIETYDFDNSSGKLSNPINDIFDGAVGNPYSLEFSQDSRLLYVTTMGLPSKIMQYDVNSKNFAQTRESVYEGKNNDLILITLQRSNQGAIFFNAQNSIGLIEKPNMKSKGCGIRPDWFSKTNPAHKMQLGISLNEQKLSSKKTKQEESAILVNSDEIMPNAFSPNGDDLNDDFAPIMEKILLENENIIEYDFKIFSRNGKLVFQTTDCKKGWDGRLNNNYLESDVYQWSLNIKTNLNKVIPKNGEVALIK